METPKIFQNLKTAATLSAAIAIAGCSTQQECTIYGGEIKGVDGINDAAQLCASNRKLILKCVKNEAGYNGDLVAITIKCADSDFQKQISSAYSYSDYTTCNASENAKSMDVTCVGN